MSQVDLTPLFADIHNLLRAERERCGPNQPACPAERADAATEYWGEHPRISQAEMRMLHALARGPLCAGSIAARLGRCEAETIRFLAALQAIGLLQQEGDRYAVTETTLAYLQLFLQW